MSNLAFLYLMGPSPEGQSPLVTFLPLILVFVIFYFFMIRPQVRKQKELNNYRSSLKKGDKIVTTGGIYGRVTDVKDNTVTVDVGDNVLLKIDKSAVLKDASDIQQKK
ncbi:MAG TPA: preprotein translocase subunit YajC [Bacteroidales bacterium]|nr:preprotein translocase subunit YajC [Bacteroidales bacterium]